MRRRDVLRRCAAVAPTGALALLAGCTGSDSSDGASPDLSVESFDYAEADDGTLSATVTVVNDGDAEGTGTLYVTVEAGDDVTRESRDVTVASGETKTVELSFSFDYATFQRKGNLSVDLRT